MKLKINFLLGLSCILLTSLHAQENVVKADIENLADKSAEKLAESGGMNQTIAIADFDNKSSKAKQENMGHAVAEIITERLKKSNKFVIIESRQINKIVSQLELEQSGLYDSKKTASVGNLVGARFMVVGSVSEIAGYYNVSVRIVKIETGEIVVTESKDVPVNTMNSIVALYKPASYRILLGAGFLRQTLASQTFGGSLDANIGIFYDLNARHFLLLNLTAAVTTSTGNEGYPATTTYSSGPISSSPATVYLNRDYFFSGSVGYGQSFPITNILTIRPYAAIGFGTMKLSLSNFAQASTNFNTALLEAGAYLTILERTPFSFWINPGVSYSVTKFNYKYNTGTTIGTITNTPNIDDSGSLFGLFIRGGFMIYI